MRATSGGEEAGDGGGGEAAPYKVGAQHVPHLGRACRVEAPPGGGRVKESPVLQQWLGRGEFSFSFLVWGRGLGGGGGG